MMTHDSRKDLARQLQVIGIKATSNHRRPFCEVDQGRQELGVPVNVAAESRFDAVATLFRLNQDKVVPQHLFIGAGRDWERIFRPKNAMAPRGVPGSYVGKLEWNDLVIQQCHEPTDGANEPNAILAGPGHALGEMNAGDNNWQLFPEGLVG